MAFNAMQILTHLLTHTLADPNLPEWAAYAEPLYGKHYIGLKAVSHIIRDTC